MCVGIKMSKGNHLDVRCSVRLYNCYKTMKKFLCPYRYKERLRTKYIKSLKPTDTSQFLHGKKWTFVKDGLDDFRDGLPPNADGILLKVGHA